jgi:DNA primase
MTDTKALKARVSILDVLLQVGGRIQTKAFNFDDEVPVWCPFCSDHDSRKPAGRANDVKGVYHCFACGFGGDVIDIARRYLGEDDEAWGAYPASFETAIEWLEKTFPDQDDPWTS